MPSPEPLYECTPSLYEREFKPLDLYTTNMIARIYIYTNGRVDIPTYKIYILSIYMYIWHEEFAVGGGYVVGVRNFLSSMKRGQCKYDYQPYANALC